MTGPSILAARFAGGALTAWCAGVFERAGVPWSEAALAAEMLVRTDARGFGTHGLSRLRSYVEKLRSGEVSATATMSDVMEGAYGVVEADGALGQVAGPFAVAQVVEATRSTPLAAVMLRNTGHLGALGLHVLRAAEAGRVALVMQATPPVIAMPGATGPMIGNNPFAIAAPRPDGPTIVVDMACGVAARGNILLAARAGRPIPEGWAVDAEGAPTTDANRALAGSLLPFAGHKGLGLAVIVELLAGSLSGRPFEAVMNKGGEVRSAAGGLNALFLVFNPDLMVGRTAYDAYVAAWTSHFKAAGQGARIPGERAHAAETAAATEGVALAPEIIVDLAALGSERGLPFPDAIDEAARPPAA